MLSRSGWAAFLLVLSSGAAACNHAPVHVTAAAAPATASTACSDLCAPSVTIGGPLFDLQMGVRPDSSFVLAPNSIELHNLQGRLLWHAAVDSEDAPRLVATGDFNGDGITDAIFRIMTTPSSPKRCGNEVIKSTRLVFVDGASGSVSYPLPAEADVCWNGFGRAQPYTTHQWGTGTAYVGPLVAGAAAVVAIPYYATEGWVLQWSSSGWKMLSSAASTPLVYPSSPAYDRLYDAVNHKPCTGPGAGPCYVDASHVANAVFLDPAQARGLFVLTSSRAFLYGSDLLPHSDLTWVSSGRTDNSGRNYGLFERLDAPDSFLMVGGCSVFNARSSMIAGTPVNRQCSLHHHIEFFQLAGARIVTHASRYFGYAGTDGVWESRIEYLLNSQPGFGGPDSVVFNLYRNGQWRLVVMPEPAHPQVTLEFPGWYAWDSVRAPDGRPLLLATRAPGGGGTASRVLPWEFDVLDWNGQGPVSILHRVGEAPAIFAYPQLDWRHSSDGLPYGVFTTPSGRGINVLVTDNSGHVTSQPIHPATPAASARPATVSAGWTLTPS
jgi:hypothetical protein